MSSGPFSAGAIPERIERAAPRRLGLPGTLTTAVQLAAVVAVIYRYHIEERFGLLRLLPLVAGGFVVHALLPHRYRRWCFLLLSIGAILVVLPFPRNVGALVLALGLFGVAQLPIAWGARVGLIGLIAVGLAAERVGLLPNLGWQSLPVRVVPLLGTMFMFRLAIYLHDIRHDRKPASLAERLGYFFLLPNPCFPLFPVVDYQTYRRTYYDIEEQAIYQKGIQWMLRGVTHLLLYRVIYLYLVPEPGDVHDFWGVVRFVVTAYLLYLRISGLFHLAVGMLCLFGFNLPETHHRYFLASGFNDFWRRINIFWKDFMMKMFYYPAFTALRRFGMATRLVLATAVVFVATWLLHSYQLFWLHGTFPLTVPDVAFWGILGVLVVINSLLEARAPRARSLGPPRWDLTRALTRSAQIVAMFGCMSLLWSMWNSPSVGEWFEVIARGRRGISGAGWLAGLFVALVVVGTLVQRVDAASLSRAGPAVRPWPRQVLATMAPCMVLLAASDPSLIGYLGQGAARTSMSLRDERALWDRYMAERGYYEELLLGSQFAILPPGWRGAREAGIMMDRPDLIDYELLPSQRTNAKEAAFVTNEWGMRDKPYSRAKQPGTYRVALLGASYEMGPAWTMPRRGRPGSKTG